MVTVTKDFGDAIILWQLLWQSGDFYQK